MESNGERNRIHVSQKTADLIELAGKGHWLTSRADKVNAKGKGMMQTYWCEPKSGSGSVVSGSDNSATEYESECNAPFSVSPNSQLARLIDWNVDMFEGLLMKVIAKRAVTTEEYPSKAADLSEVLPIAGKPLDEVTEVVGLPKSEPMSSHPAEDIKLSSAVSSQLREYIVTIAKLYRANPFHNFEHCSHVAMSTKKLLDRIAMREERIQQTSSSIAGSSYGIIADPLTRFAVVFAALIHDVDHSGVSNAQLVHENAAVAVTYDGKSVAEQHAVTVAWSLLMEPKFTDLRARIFSNESELKHFRQILVNVVMATDLFDHDLQAMRESRWVKSFSETAQPEMAPSAAKDDSNRRVTIIIELLIQASDVSHTMQHFTVYKKWNLRLLAEMYEAYQMGRSAKDPTEGWYEGELWFFDNYIIPLAKKLRECGVFGVSCDEFLDYAKDNRMEWEMKGREIVREVVEALKEQDRTF
jgi:3'5'-cyclic nucleotide phosphodiesterase